MAWLSSTSSTRALDNVLPYRKLNELGARLDAELLHHAVLVKLHRSRRYVQHVGHLLHCMPLGEELQAVMLAWTEPVQRLLFRRRHERPDEAGGDERSDVRSSVGHFANRGQQLDGGRPLEEIGGRAGAKRLGGEVRIFVHR